MYRSLTTTLLILLCSSCTFTTGKPVDNLDSRHGERPNSPIFLDRRDPDANPLIGRRTHWHGFSSLRRLFVFGDSYTSNGFDQNGIQPNNSYPDGPIRLNASADDGYSWSEYLTLYYNQSAVRLYDMAVGGACVNKSLAPELYNIVYDFTEQVQYKWIPAYYTKKSATWSTEYSLFSAWFGINDIISTSGKHSEALLTQIFQSYLATLNVLYNSGARNFLLIKAPAFNRSPGFNCTSLGGATCQWIGWGISEWNARIDAMAYNLTLSHQDTTVFVFDAFKIFNQVLDYPPSYLATVGIVDTTHNCPAYGSGTPNQTYHDPSCPYAVNQYFWLNGLHPTWMIHNVMAQQISYLLQDQLYGRVIV